MRVVLEEERYQRVLRAWEATNSERDLHGVLRAVGALLEPRVPADAIAVVVHKKDAGSRRDWNTDDSGEPGQPQGMLFALHSLDPASTLSPDDHLRNAREPPSRPPDRPIVPYGPEIFDRMRAGVPYACADVLAKDTWYPHEHHLADGGIRAYTSVPLKRSGQLIGTVVFSRREPVGFTDDQLSFLTDIAGAIAVAVANALDNEEIRSLRDQLEAENIALKAQLAQAPWFEDIVGSSDALRRTLESVEQVATTDATVLLTGETGTGKELIARAIHRRSPRAAGPLVNVHCAAIPPTILASELFGHERGAFTGAAERRKGRFEQAHRGTLFLDEVGELPAEAQVMLLRVLQEREFERLGGSVPVRVDVRIVAATNRNLEEEVRAGRFRDDLFYRLNVFPVRVPPLRERDGDLPLLVSHFAEKHGARLGRAFGRIERRSLKWLEGYSWPGNVRELENIVERAVILSPGATLRIDRQSLAGAVAQEDIRGHLTDQEREAVEAALHASRGRISGPKGAARRLGLPPSTLESRIKKLGIDKFRYRTVDPD
jgi:formate hydrogenlyase transcriptional activator